MSVFIYNRFTISKEVANSNANTPNKNAYDPLSFYYKLTFLASKFLLRIV